MTRLAAIMLLIIMVGINVLSVPGVIRLHVIANSDCSEDQFIKELVRDRLVETLTPALAELDQRQAESLVISSKNEIVALAEQVLMEQGVDQTVTLNYDVETYPARLYGNALVPAGRYRSLKVIIGSGSGQNWWCMLFPSLCFVSETTEEDQDGGYSHTVGKQDVQVRFWIWDKLSQLFK